ncbi:hypothetical protein Rs2_08257 [Raphanus sativus]|uniref:Uncharacterized protein LOC108842860 n=1 Tax=Raphanus sativus TaxID=3726 RepID=A0A6J0MG24_RAPSA|nr:uncharacterized protein LOC108842860 [Raphanus sativus]XP_018471407.2 uncharacterized protein LOC108842860 [Raphanus sativus]KAJ4913636.1 hypothetical protein Rs2_08257 [Raphanus sativus]
MELVCEKKLQQANTTFCSTTIINWDDLVCPICLDSPHNAVLLQCSSYQNGCRAFVCNTDHLHSNCLDRFITACGTTTDSPPPPAPDGDTLSKVLEENCKPVCPLCRGEVTGWVVVEEARVLLDEKKRSCEEHRCRFTGTYAELREHAKSEHPDSRPSKIDPARKLDWENFQQSSEIIDVLSTIHSEVPRGVVLGDYVIEYGDDDGTGDELEDVPGNAGSSWWTSCILYKVFDNIRNARRNRRRSRMMINESRRGSRRSSYDNSNSDDSSSSVASIEFPVYRVDEIDDEFITTTTGGINTSSAMHQRFSLVYNSRRRRSRFYAN